MDTETASPGELIGEHYEVIEALGLGGNANVFLVRHLKTGDLFAMKLLSTEQFDLEEGRRRFEREAAVISKLAHQNLVSLHEYGTSASGKPFIVTDYVQGNSLDSLLIAGNRLEPRRACSIFIQICQAMEYAHQSGLIHRDLKPSNIMVSVENGSERVRIVDFGLVKAFKGPESESKLTQEGEVVGSPCYMSPEQCRGVELDNRTDIYSLGCIMYETLCGQPPFTAPYPMAILVKQVSSPVTGINEEFPESRVDPQLESIVLKTLAKDPGQRHQTMSELEEELTSFLNDGSAE